MSYTDSEQTKLIRQKMGGRIVNFKDILPSKQMIHAILTTCKSTGVDLSEFDGKLYEDEIFSQEMPRAASTYSILQGEWLIAEEYDEFTEMPIIKFTDNKSGQYFKIAFPDHINKIKFLNEMSASQDVHQETSGMNIEGIVNKNTIYPKKKALVKAVAAFAITGIGLLAYFNRRKNVN